MSNKYFGGLITNPCVKAEVDEELIALALDTPKRVEKKMNELRVGDAIDEIFTLLRRTNKYIDETTPWVLGKEESQKDRLATVLYNLLESIRFAAVLLESYMPQTSEKILDALGTKQRTLESLETFGNLETGGNVIKKMEILFARIDAEEFMKQLEADKEKEAKEEQTGTVAEPKGKEEISIEDFAKMELKVGTVVACEKHPKADRLLVEQIDLGGETRQIVSGIAKFFTPEEMIGRKVIVVTNLKPVKLRGVESQGMILCAATEDDAQLDLATICKDLPNGTTVR